MKTPHNADKLLNAFAAEMTALLPLPPACVAIAVSGGSDSMALALLTQEWARRAGVALLAFSVDHGLRPEAAAEARQVRDWLGEIGIETVILTWTGPHPQSGVQQAAREARYALMTAECRARGISHLLLGHQLEDQLETFLMRLSKGSGLEGLAAMEPAGERDGIKLLRPLLGIPRERLRQYLQQRWQGWIDDPGNDNPVFTRTRVGGVLAALQALPGSGQDSIALALARLQRANDSLEQLAAQFLWAEAEIDPFGAIKIANDALYAQPEEIALRALAASLRTVGGGAHIRLAAVEDLYQRMRASKAAGATMSATLGGAYVTRKGHHWHFCREAGRQGLPEVPLKDGETGWIWDQRFYIHDLAPSRERSDNLTLRALGPAGGREAVRRALLPAEAAMTAKQRNSLPGVWRGDRLLAVPLPPRYISGQTSGNQRFCLDFRAFYWIPRGNSC